MKAISRKLDKILQRKNISDIKCYRSNLPHYSFDKSKLIKIIEKQFDLLLKNYNLSFSTRRYSYWSIQLNSSIVYESFNRKLDKIINHVEADKITFTRGHHSHLLVDRIKILAEIDKKLNKISKLQLRLTT